MICPTKSSITFRRIIKISIKTNYLQSNLIIIDCIMNNVGKLMIMTPFRTFMHFGMRFKLQCNIGHDIESLLHIYATRYPSTIGLLKPPPSPNIISGGGEVVLILVTIFTGCSNLSVIYYTTGSALNCHLLSSQKSIQNRDRMHRFWMLKSCNWCVLIHLAAVLCPTPPLLSFSTRRPQFILS